MKIFALLCSIVQECADGETEQKLIDVIAEVIPVVPFVIALPTSIEEWARPADLAPAQLIAKSWRKLWDKHHGTPPQSIVAQVWKLRAPAARRILELLVEAIKQDPQSIKILHKVFNVERQGSLTKYRKQLQRIFTDPNIREYLQLSKELRRKLASRMTAGERRQINRNYVDLVDSASKLKVQFDQFVQMLAKKTGATAIQAPVKGPWRVLEKIVFRQEHEPGDDLAQLDASSICDCLRGAIQCPDFSTISSVVELLTWLDNSDMGQPDRVEEIEKTFRIRLIRAKCRFSKPTSGGWADLLINFRFLDDASKHVAELQIQHAKLLLVRKEDNAHVKYNIFRSAYEILETIGQPPIDQLDEQDQRFTMTETGVSNDATGGVLKEIVDQQQVMIRRLEETNRCQTQEIERLKNDVQELKAQFSVLANALRTTGVVDDRTLDVVTGDSRTARAPP